MSDSLPPATVDASGLTPQPPMSFVELTKVLREPLRWRILRELASGERLMVIEIAKRIRKPATLVSKHLTVLRKARLVAIRQRLHYMPDGLNVDTDTRVLDLGYCVLRLDTIEGRA